MLSPDRVLGVITTVQNVLNRSRKNWTGKKTKNLKSTIFSDSIIISIELDGDIEYKRSLYKILCSIVSEIQFELLLNNVWIRGGISHGNLAFVQDSIYNDTIIYGEALVNAYILESQNAIFPRIVIDPNIIQFLKFKSKSDFMYYFNEYDNIFIKEVIFNTSDILCQEIEHRYLDIDTPLFLDYLDYIISKNMVSYSNLNLKHFLDDLESNLNNKNSDIFKKYNWVRLYALQKIESVFALSEGVDTQKMRSLNDALLKLIEM